MEYNNNNDDDVWLRLSKCLHATHTGLVGFYCRCETKHDPKCKLRPSSCVRVYEPYAPFPNQWGRTTPPQLTAPPGVSCLWAFAIVFFCHLFFLCTSYTYNIYVYKFFLNSFRDNAAAPLTGLACALRLSQSNIILNEMPRLRLQEWKNNTNNHNINKWILIINYSCWVKQAPRCLVVSRFLAKNINAKYYGLPGSTLYWQSSS